MVEKGDRYRRHLRKHSPRYKAMLDFTALSSAERVLDVGIEPYIFANMLAEESPEGVELYGIAYGDAGDKHEKELVGRQINVRSCNIEQDTWPFEDDSVNRVVMGAIIEHLFDPLSALEEARRVLSPDGLLVLSTPNAVRFVTRLRTLLGFNPYDGFPLESKYNRHNHEWTRDELLDIFEVAGFKVEQERYEGIRRSGKTRIVSLGNYIHRSLADQMIFQCSVAEPLDRLPVTYRSGLTETSGKS